MIAALDLPVGRPAACGDDPAEAAQCCDAGRLPRHAASILSKLSRVCLHLETLAALILLVKSKINRGFSHARLLSPVDLEHSTPIEGPIYEMAGNRDRRIGQWPSAVTVSLRTGRGAG
jgi:hypothetical protein